MKATLHINWRHPRLLNLRVKRAAQDESDANIIATCPSPIGAFAAMLVEWKQAQMKSVAEEAAEPRSA